MSTSAGGRLQDPLSRFGARVSGSTLRTGIGGFLLWWGQALAAWLPPRMRQLLGMNRGRLLMLVEGEALLLRLQRGDEIRDLGNIPALTEMEPGRDPPPGVRCVAVCPCRRRLRSVCVMWWASKSNGRRPLPPKLLSTTRALSDVAKAMVRSLPN
jgi:hypothetical protein